MSHVVWCSFCLEIAKDPVGLGGCPHVLCRAPCSEVLLRSSDDGVRIQCPVCGTLGIVGSTPRATAGGAATAARVQRRGRPAGAEELRHDASKLRERVLAEAEAEASSISAATKSLRESQKATLAAIDAAFTELRSALDRRRAELVRACEALGREGTAALSARAESLRARRERAEGEVRRAAKIADGSTPEDPLLLLPEARRRVSSLLSSSSSSPSGPSPEALAALELLSSPEFAADAASHGAVVSGLDVGEKAVAIEGPRGTITGEPISLKIRVGGPVGLADLSGKPLDERAVAEAIRCLSIEIVGPNSDQVPPLEDRSTGWIAEAPPSAAAIGGAPSASGSLRRRPSMSYGGRIIKREIAFTPHEPGEYRIVLARSNRLGEVRRTHTTVTVFQSLPTPTGIKLDQCKCDSAELSWESGAAVSMTEVLRFAVKVDQLDNPKRTIVDGQVAEKPHIRVEGLQRCTNYSVLVAAVAARSLRQGEWSAPFEFTSSKTSNTKLDPHCAGKNCAVDPSGLSVTISAAGGTVLSDEGFSSGRHYFEFKVQHAGSNSWCGVSLKPPGDLDKWLGWDSTGWGIAGFHGDRRVCTPYHAGRPTGAPLPRFTDGDHVGFLLDCEAGVLTYFVNGNKIGDAFVGELRGKTLFPAFSTWHEQARYVDISFDQPLPRFYKS